MEVELVLQWSVHGFVPAFDTPEGEIKMNTKEYYGYEPYIIRTVERYCI